MICFEVRAYSFTFPPSHRKIFTNSSTQDFPYREAPLRIWIIQAQKYTAPLSNKYNLSLEARHKANTRSISQMRDRAQSHNNDHPLTRGILTNSITSTLRGIITIQCTTSFTLRGQSAKLRANGWIQLLVVLTNHKPNLSYKNKILIDRIDMIAQV